MTDGLNGRIGAHVCSVPTLKKNRQHTKLDYKYRYYWHKHVLPHRGQKTASSKYKAKAELDTLPMSCYRCYHLKMCMDSFKHYTSLETTLTDIVFVSSLCKNNNGNFFAKLHLKIRYATQAKHYCKMTALWMISCRL